MRLDQRSAYRNPSPAKGSFAAAGNAAAAGRWQGASSYEKDEFVRHASRVYTGDTPSASSAVVETVYRKPRVYADIHEYDEEQTIDRVPTAVGYHSFDSLEEIRSRHSRYEIELDESEEKSRRTDRSSKRSSESDGSYSESSSRPSASTEPEEMDDGRYGVLSKGNTGMSNDSDSQPAVWVSPSAEENLLKERDYKAALENAKRLNALNDVKLGRKVKYALRDSHFEERERQSHKQVRTDQRAEQRAELHAEQRMQPHYDNSAGDVVEEKVYVRKKPSVTKPLEEPMAKPWVKESSKKGSTWNPFRSTRRRHKQPNTSGESYSQSSVSTAQERKQKSEFVLASPALPIQQSQSGTKSMETPNQKGRGGPIDLDEIPTTSYSGEGQGIVVDPNLRDSSSGTKQDPPESLQLGQIPSSDSKSKKSDTHSKSSKNSVSVKSRGSRSSVGKEDASLKGKSPSKSSISGSYQPRPSTIAEHDESFVQENDWESAPHQAEAVKPPSGSEAPEDIKPEGDTETDDKQDMVVSKSQDNGRGSSHSQEQAPIGQEMTEKQQQEQDPAENTSQGVDHRSLDDPVKSGSQSAQSVDDMNLAEENQVGSVYTNRGGSIPSSIKLNAELSGPASSKGMIATRASGSAPSAADLAPNKSNGTRFSREIRPDTVESEDDASAPIKEIIPVYGNHSRNQRRSREEADNDTFSDTYVSNDDIIKIVRDQDEPSRPEQVPNNEPNVDGFTSWIMNGFDTLAKGFNVNTSFLDWENDTKKTRKTQYRSVEDEQGIFTLRKSPDSYYPSSSGSGAHSQETENRSKRTAISMLADEDDSRIRSPRSSTRNRDEENHPRLANMDVRDERMYPREKSGDRAPPRPGPGMHGPSPGKELIAVRQRVQQIENMDSKGNKTEVKSLRLENHGNDLGLRDPAEADKVVRKAETPSKSVKTFPRDHISVSSIEIPTPTNKSTPEDEYSISILGLRKRRTHKNVKSQPRRKYPQEKAKQTKPKQSQDKPPRQSTHKTAKPKQQHRKPKNRKESAPSNKMVTRGKQQKGKAKSNRKADKTPKRPFSFLRRNNE